jgi:hypothetical protein
MPDLDPKQDVARLPAVSGAGTFDLGDVWRYLDVVLVVLAIGPAIALGAPALGVIVGSVGWIVQRVLQAADSRLIRRARERRDLALGVNLVEAFGRIWLLAGAIIVAGVVGGRADGLAAAVVIFAAYSIAFAVRIVQGRPGGPTR